MMKVRYKWNGEEISEQEYQRKKPLSAPGIPMIAQGFSAARPQESIALGVHRSQVREFNAMYADAGITGASHRPDGTCVVETRKARNAVMKLRGIRDNDAGYGDWAGNN